MLFFRHSYKPWLIGTAIAAMLFTVTKFEIGSWSMLASWPALEILHQPTHWWRSFSLWFTDSAQLQAQYLAYKRQVQRQAVLIQEANALREENRQLRKLLDISGVTGYRWHAAKVLGRSPEKMSQRLLLQAARSDVSTDDVIVSSEGLVGLVDAVSGRHATVRTIFDASISVPVTIPGTSLAALSRGQGDSLSIDFVPLTMAVATGSVLYTSGAGGLFPPGIAVARVVDVMPVQGDLFVRIVAEPVAHWQRDNWLAIASHIHSK